MRVQTQLSKISRTLNETFCVVFWSFSSRIRILVLLYLKVWVKSSTIGARLFDKLAIPLGNGKQINRLVE